MTKNAQRERTTFCDLKIGDYFIFVEKKEFEFDGAGIYEKYNIDDEIGAKTWEGVTGTIKNFGILEFVEGNEEVILVDLPE